MGSSSRRTKKHRKTWMSWKTTSKWKTSAILWKARRTRKPAQYTWNTWWSSSEKRQYIGGGAASRAGPQGMNTEITQAHRGNVRKAEAQLELSLARSIKGSNKNFYYYFNSKRLDKENVDWYPNEVSYRQWTLLRSRYSTVFSVSAFTSTAFMLRDRVQSKEPPVMNEN